MSYVLPGQLGLPDGRGGKVAPDVIDDEVSRAFEEGEQAQFEEKARQAHLILCVFRIFHELSETDMCWMLIMEAERWGGRRPKPEWWKGDV